MSSRLSSLIAISRSAAQDVRDRVNTLGRRLPEDATPPVVQKFDNDSTPVLTIALTADRSLRELTELADKTVRVQLERVGGVGEVRVVGGLDRAINVWIDAERLGCLSDSHHCRFAQALDTPKRRRSRRKCDYRQGRADACARSVASPIRDSLTIWLSRTLTARRSELRDVGRVEDGTKEQRSFSRLNGVPTVTLDIRRQSGANTIEVINGIKSALPRVAAQLPEDVKLEVIRDQSRYIESALHEIETHLILGSILASLVVLVVHAFVALDVDCRGRDSVFSYLHVRDDARARLHAEQRDDAGAGVDGRRGDRRRDRRSGEHLPLH